MKEFPDGNRQSDLAAEKKFSTLPRNVKIGDNDRSEAARYRNYSGSSSARCRSSYEFQDAIGAFNPVFHSFSVELPAIKIGEYRQGGQNDDNPAGSLKRERSKSGRSVGKLSLSRLTRSPSPLWMKDDITCPSFADMLKLNRKKRKSGCCDSSSSSLNECKGCTLAIRDPPVSSVSMECVNMERKSLARPGTSGEEWVRITGMRHSDGGSKYHANSNSNRSSAMDLSALEWSGDDEAEPTTKRRSTKGSGKKRGFKPPEQRLSREYKDAIINSRRRSKKDKDDGSAKTEAETKILSTAGSFTRKRSRGSRKKRAANQDHGKDEQYHRGVATDIVAQYLKDMERDEFEFVSQPERFEAGAGVISVVGNDQEGQVEEGRDVVVTEAVTVGTIISEPDVRVDTLDITAVELHRTERTTTTMQKETLARSDVDVLNNNGCDETKHSFWLEEKENVSVDNSAPSTSVRIPLGLGEHEIHFQCSPPRTTASAASSGGDGGFRQRVDLGDNLSYREFVWSEGDDDGEQNEERSCKVAVDWTASETPIDFSDGGQAVNASILQVDNLTFRRA